MKNLILLLFLLSINNSYSQLNYNIVNAFPAPTSNLGDLTFDGTYLWLGSHFENGSLYQISPVDGAVIKVINVNLTGIDGLTFGNGTLWAAENNSSFGQVILEVDTITGQTLTTINHSLGDFTHGMEFHNNNLYVNMFYSGVTDTTFVLDQTGNIVEEHPLTLNNAHGIAYDGCSFWITSNESGGTFPAIHEINELTFGVMNSEGIPGGNYPNGLA